MRWIFVVVITLHGLLHLLGFAKAFGFAELPQLTQPISRAMGMLWLAAALAMLVAAAAFLQAPRWFWVVGAGALPLSQLVLFMSWHDARAGTLANVVLLVGVVMRFASHGPYGLRAEYAEAVADCRAEPLAEQVVNGSELEKLPRAVQRYLRLAGVVGRPRITSFKATWKGRIRAGAAEPWMTFGAEQYNFYGEQGARLFFMAATMKHLPVDVFHRFLGSAATFRVRLLSLFPMVDAKGPAMDRAETVTLFNDMCVLAPSTLLDASVAWPESEITENTVQARFTRGEITISAVLSFNDEGELVDFVSDDRFPVSPDGTAMPQQWQTPLRAYRDFGGRRVSTIDQANWNAPGGAYTYGEFELLAIEYNVPAHGRSATRL